MRLTDALTFIACSAPLQLLDYPSARPVGGHQHDPYAITDQDPQKVPPHRVREMRGHDMPVDVHFRELTREQLDDYTLDLGQISNPL